MDPNQIVQDLMTFVPLGMWVIPYASDALVNLGLMADGG